jgi:hypothetical protein
MRAMLRKVLNHLSPSGLRPDLRAIHKVSNGSNAAGQILLQLEYRRLVEEEKRLPKLNEVGFKVYSQSDEDGILLFLFSIIGVTSKKCVEICAGDGIECNTANLILNHGWHALLVDGNQQNVDRGNKFYETSEQTYVYPPQFVCSWVTRENVNQLLKSNGFSGEIDLLSVDMDGVDYWIWDAIEEISPRVVVLEYQDILGPDRACTVPYSPNFQASAYTIKQHLPNYCGASLLAFTKLARRKGYRLIGTNRYGYNAFFILAGLAEDLLPTIEVKDCFSHPKVIAGMRDRFPVIENHPWVEV